MALLVKCLPSAGVKIQESQSGVLHWAPLLTAPPLLRVSAPGSSSPSPPLFRAYFLSNKIFKNKKIKVTLNMTLPYKKAIPILSIQKKWKHMCNIIHKSQKVAKTQMFINWWRVNKTLVQSYNGLFGKQKRMKYWHILYNMHESWKLYSKSK